MSIGLHAEVRLCARSASKRASERLGDRIEVQLLFPSFKYFRLCRTAKNVAGGGSPGAPVEHVTRRRLHSERGPRGGGGREAGAKGESENTRRQRRRFGWCCDAGRLANGRWTPGFKIESDAVQTARIHYRKGPCGGVQLLRVVQGKAVLCCPQCAMIACCKMLSGREGGPRGDTRRARDA